MTGPKVRERSESFDDHFTQATLFWNSQSDAEKRHIVSAGQFELGKVEHLHIRQRVCDLFFHIDEDLARRVAEGVGVTEVTGDLSYLERSTAPRPGPARGAAAPGVAPSLSMDGQQGSPATRKVAVLVAEGHDHARSPRCSNSSRPPAPSRWWSRPGSGPVRATVARSRSTRPSARRRRSSSTPSWSPAAPAAVEALQGEGDAVQFVGEAFKHAKPLAAIGAGVSLLEAARLPGVELAAATDGATVSDQGVVTAGDGGDPTELAAQFVEAIAAHRHWGRQLGAVPA
jgi:catalase